MGTRTQLRPVLDDDVVEVGVRLDVMDMDDAPRRRDDSHGFAFKCAYSDLWLRVEESFRVA